MFGFLMARPENTLFEGVGNSLSEEKAIAEIIQAGGMHDLKHFLVLNLTLCAAPLVAFLVLASRKVSRALSVNSTRFMVFLLTPRLFLK
jgi:uncharacterized membrane protein